MLSAIFHRFFKLNQASVSVTFEEHIIPELYRKHCPVVIITNSQWTPGINCPIKRCHRRAPLGSQGCELFREQAGIINDRGPPYLFHFLFEIHNTWAASRAVVASRRNIVRTGFSEARSRLIVCAPRITATLRMHPRIYHRPESHPRRGKE